MGKLVYISACGIGLGHIGRMVPVAEELRKLGAECVFSTYGPAARYAANAGFRALDSPALMWEENDDGSIATGRSIGRMGRYLRIFAAHMRLERERLSSLRPDAVMCDSRYSTLFVEDLIDKPFFFVSNQLRFLMPRWKEGGWPRWASDRISRTNYHWLRDADGIFVPDFPMPHSISRDNMDFPPEFRKRVTFTGPISRKRPEDLPEASEILERHGLGKDLFVYAGVSGPGRSRAPVIQILTELLPRFERTSVIDRGEPGSDLNIWKGKHLNIRGWAPDRFGFMKSCQVVISRPGLTTISEIVRFGKPCVLIPTPTQSEQEGNALSMRDHGAARVVPQASVNLSTMREALDDLSGRAEEYARRARALQARAAEMDGAANIARRVMEHVTR